MRDIADLSGPVYASSGSHGGCYVHLSWHEQSRSTPKAKRGLITVRSIRSLPNIICRPLWLFFSTLGLP